MILKHGHIMPYHVNNELMLDIDNCSIAGVISLKLFGRGWSEQFFGQHRTRAKRPSAAK